MIDLREGRVGDGLDLLESAKRQVETESSEYARIEEALGKLRRREKQSTLKNKELQKVTKLLKRHSGSIDERLLQKVKDRIRKRRQRSTQPCEHRVLVSEKTKKRLDRMKNRPDSNGAKRYATYDDVISRLFRAYDAGKRGKKRKG